MFQFLPEDSPQETEVRQTTRQLCDQILRPHAVYDDEKSYYRKEFFNELGKIGLLASFAPMNYGGNEFPFSTHYTMLEEVSRASLSMTVVVGVNNLVQGGILAFGTETQKEQYLPKLIKGEWLGAFSLSESHSGSDAASLRMSAKKVSGGYVLNGTKMWCSNAGHADLYLVMGRTSEDGPKGITAFLVEKNAGFRIGKSEKKLGLRGSTLAELVFENCFVPEENRLGTEGQGFKVALSQLDAGRITIGVGGLGTAIEALTQYWTIRRQSPHAFEQGSRDTCARFFAEIQALRLLIRAGAKMRDLRQTITVIASQIKWLGSDLAVHVSSEAITGLGFEGYTKKLGVERLLRDAKALQIVEGTNQVQSLLLSREMDKFYETMGTP